METNDLKILAIDDNRDNLTALKAVVSDRLPGTRLLTAQIRAMAKIRAANQLQRLEKEQLAALVAERTRELEQELVERKRAEENLEKESRMRTALLDNIPGCIALLLKKGTREIVACNRFAREIGAVPGQTCFKTCARRDDNCPFCRAPKLWKTGQSQRLEVEYRGTWYEGIWVPLSEDLYVHYIFDITERRRTEEALRALSSRQEAILAAVPEIIMEVDCNKVYMWANRAGVEFFGEDVIGKEAAFYFEGEQDTYGTVQPLFNGDEQVFYVESWQRRRDGQKRLLAWWCRVLKDAQGTMTGALSTARDITERQRTEEALRASQQIIEGIINAIPVRVFWKDKNLVYLGCNAAFARDGGFADPKDIIGKDDYQMGWRDQAELYRGDDRQVIESGCSKFLIEEPQTTPEGNTSTLLTSKIPLRSSKGEISGVLGTYMDITERKRAEEKIKSQLEELQRWQDVMLGREDRLQELKREVNELCRRIGETARYPSQEAGSAESETVEPKS